MQSIQTIEPATVKSRPWRQYVTALLKNRRALILLALVLIGGGAALGWHWLVAIGIAPTLVAFAPCAAMCALGLCMSRKGTTSCSTGAGTAEGPDSKSAPAGSAKPGIEPLR